MPEISYPVEMVSGVPVVTATDDLDVTTADRLRAALLEAAANGHATVVVDMTRTRFCDSSAFGVLIRAHKRALEKGGELRLVIPADGAVYRIFNLTSLYNFIPRFDSLPEALLPRRARRLPGADWFGGACAGPRRGRSGRWPRRHLPARRRRGSSPRPAVPVRGVRTEP